MTYFSDNHLINENIFNRLIFGKAKREEMDLCMNYYSDKEIFEKCIVIKELINCKYFIDEPIENDLIKIKNLLKEYKNELQELEDSVFDFDNDFIDLEKSEIISKVLEINKIKKLYLLDIYNDIKNINEPIITKEKAKKLLDDYRKKSIKNLEKVIVSLD